MRHAIDIGGGSTKIGLVSDDGLILQRRRITSEPQDHGDAITQGLATAVTGLLTPQVIGGGIGYLGPIHPGNLSGGIGNVAGLNDYPLAQRLTALLNLPARLENDATASAMAKARFGAGRTSRRMMMVTADTGIGVAMIADVAAMITSGGCLGDAGHIIVNGASHLRCRLGCTGCLEALASAEALDDLAPAEAALLPMGAIALQAASASGPATAAMLIRCALARDATAQTMPAEAGRWIGRAGPPGCIPLPRTWW